MVNHYAHARFSSHFVIFFIWKHPETIFYPELVFDNRVNTNKIYIATENYAWDLINFTCKACMMKVMFIYATYFGVQMPYGD